LNRLLLFDGHNLLCQAFYGIPERLLPDGRPIQGVVGFLGIMIKVIKTVEPTHILVVFDPEETAARTLLYENYKGNRRDLSNAPARENPFSQLAGIKIALEKLDIKYLEQPGHEADDMIASLAANTDGEVIIVSTDTDFLQLVNGRIKVFRYQGKKSALFSEAAVQEKYGVHPSRFIEYKALVGDKTDNIMGIKGIGLKTAIKVLNSQRTLTAEEQEIFQRNCDIIALDTGVKCPLSFNQLSFNWEFVGLNLGEFLKTIRII
jgi:DNA polymerase-1